MSFATANAELTGRLVAMRAWLQRHDIVARQEARVIAEDGHIMRMLPLHFLFDRRDAAALAEAAFALMDLQTRLMRGWIDRLGRDGFLDMFGVPDPMRRLVNWDALLDTRHLVSRMDILPGRDGYSFCEFNTDTCVAAAEIFDFCDLYFQDLGFDLRGAFGAVAPLADLAAMIARRAAEQRAARIVILDWSVDGGSPGKGYLSFDRMKGYLERQAPGIPVHIENEKSFDTAWLTAAEAPRTLVYRAFVMQEMDDGGAFLDRLIAAGCTVFATHEAEIRMDKGWFALFHDPDVQKELSDAERALVATYIPWSRTLTPDTLDDVIRDKDAFFFKERRSYGGTGILVGAQTTAEDLRSVLGGEACRDWIAQRVMPLETIHFPNDGRLEPQPHEVVLGLYIYGDRANGMLVRGSTHSKVVNVTVGNAKLAWGLCVDDAQRSTLLSHLTRGPAC